MSSAKPVVFVLCLDRQQQWEGFFDYMYADQVALLSSKYRVVRVRKTDAAQQYLLDPQNKPIAILITDPGVVQPSSSAVLDLVKAYVDNGGIAVFMANFGCFIKPYDMENLWKQQWGLDWKMADYYRTTLDLNRASLFLSAVKLNASYNPKAVYLKGVPTAHALYTPSPQSARTQSLFYPPEPVEQDQTPATFVKRGWGWLSYLGDVNNEAGTQMIVMEICRFAAYIAGH